MAELRQFKPTEKLLLLILLNENRPVSVHKLSQLAGISTQRILQNLYVLTKGLRLILTNRQEVEIGIKESDININNADHDQNSLFENNKI